MNANWIFTLAFRFAEKLISLDTQESILFAIQHETTGIAEYRVTYSDTSKQVPSYWYRNQTPFR